jgi:flagellar assembly protein FliH
METLVQTANILDANGYTVGGQPYQVQQIAAAAIKELQRKRAEKDAPAPSADADKAPVVDPEAQRQREEAEQVKLQAARLLRGAEQQAKSVLEKAETEAAALRTKAKEEGYQEGVASGTEAGYEEGERKGEEAGLGKHAEATARFEALFTNALKEKDAYFADREALMVELAIRVAAKVIGREVDTRPDHVQHLMKQAIRRLSDRAKLTVTLHPDDLERVTQARAEGALSFNGVKQLEFLADDTMVPGGLKIQSGVRTLDASLDSQLTEIVRGLLEEAYHEA